MQLGKLSKLKSGETLDRVQIGGGGYQKTCYQLLQILGDGTGQRGDRQAVFGGGELMVLNGKISSFVIT